VSELPSYPRGASEREEAQVPPGAGTESVYSGWWRRAGALVIDSLLVFGAVAAVFALAFGVDAVNSDVGAAMFLAAIVFFLAGPIWYWIYLTGRAPGQTLGKKALGIRVRHADEDRPIGYGAAAGRYLITVAFGFFYVPAIVDYLWPIWDARNQSLHDKVANSIVVRT
jgi:uncharacterized RDD family membrane protein YckC